MAFAVDGKGTENPYKIRDELQGIMPAKVGIFRTEKEMSEGLVKIRELRERFKHIRPEIKTQIIQYGSCLDNGIGRESRYRGDRSRGRSAQAGKPRRSFETGLHQARRSKLAQAYRGDLVA